MKKYYFITALVLLLLATNISAQSPDDTTVPLGNVVITWPAYPAFTGVDNFYVITIGTDANNLNTRIETPHAAVPVNTCDFFTLLENQQYFWRLEVWKNGVLLSEFPQIPLDPWDFIIDTFENVSPTDGATVPAAQVLFDWNDFGFENDGTAEDDFYHITVFLDAAGTNPIMTQALNTTSSQSQLPMNLIPPGTYWWRVQAEDDGALKAETPLFQVTVGPATSPEIDVQRPAGNSIASGGTDDVGAKGTGVQFNTSYTVANSGDASLDISSFTITNESNCTGASAQATASVAIGGTASVSVNITPTVAGPFSLSFNMISNDSDESPYTINIQGTATSKEIDVTGNNISIPDGDVTPQTADFTDFGKVNVTGGTSENLFLINNMGTQTLTLTDPTPFVTITGHTTDFTLTQIPNGTIPATGSTQFKITFDPTASGLRQANVSIANDDADENPYTFDIQGQGNTAPTSADNSVGTNEDTDAVILTADFNYSDPESDSFVGIVITSNPTKGILYNDGGAIGVVEPGEELAVNDGVRSNDIALGNLKFKPDPDEYGTPYVTFKFKVDDGLLTSNEHTMTVNVTGLNDAPVLSGIEGLPMEYREGDGFQSISNTITITDIDDQNIDRATIQITGNYQPGEDVLGFEDNGITSNWDETTGTLTLTGPEATLVVADAIRLTGYNNLSDTPVHTVTDSGSKNIIKNITATPRTVSFTVFDGDDNSNTVTRDINITPTNDKPIVEINAGLTLDEGTTAEITEDMLFSTDPDGNGYLIYTIIDIPVNGLIVNDGAVLEKHGTFTQDDLNEGIVFYAHNGTETTSDKFFFEVADNRNSTAEAEYFTITINPTDNPPAAPTDLSVTYDENGYIVLTWVDNAGNEISYEVWRQLVSNARIDFIMSYELIATLEANTETYIDNSLTEGASYQYKVLAVNGDGSGEAATGDEGGQANPIAPLSKPTNLIAEANSNGTITITWTDNSGLEDGYKIFRRVGSDIWQSIATVAANTENYTDSGVDEAVTYHYCVRAFNSENESADSNDDFATVIITGVEDWVHGTPTEYILNQNYPNPFNPGTTISYGLPAESYVRISVYNMIGEEIEVLKEGYESAGYHEVQWNAFNLSSGLYLYKISAQSNDGDDQIELVRKMMLMK